MARNGSGVYEFPANTDAVTGETISSSKYNTRLNDIETDLNTARPIVAGGTGATSAAAARANLEALNDIGVTTYITGSGTYTPASDVVAIRVTCVGGGGGGAGAEVTSGSNFCAGGGGGAGGTSIKFISRADLAASYTYAVGAAGAAGSAAPSSAVGARDGGDGGDTTFADGASLSITASGGSGATEDAQSSAGTQFLGGTGGAATGGDINFSGGSGGGGITNPSSYGQIGFGTGGSSPFGLGAPSRFGDGLAGSGFGSGGSGSGQAPGTTFNSAGGAGRVGIIIIEEFTE